MIEDIKERLKNATAGPWLNGGDSVKSREGAVYGYPPTDGVICGLRDGEYIDNQNSKNDAEFIANAPADIEYLLSIIEQADKALKRLQSKAYMVGNTVMLHELNVEIEALQAIRK